MLYKKIYHLLDYHKYAKATHVITCQKRKKYMKCHFRQKFFTFLPVWYKNVIS